MELRPLGDKVVVEPLTEQTTVSGIVIPDTAKDKPNRARVVAVGTGRLMENGTRVPLEVQPEDIVLLGSDVGSRIRVENRDLLIIAETDILAVVANAPALI